MKDNTNWGTVVIPIYNEKLSDEEYRVLKHNLSNLSERWKVCFIAPIRLGTAWYEANIPEVGIRKWNEWDGTVNTYNKMLLDKTFYLFLEIFIIC
jgi:hypothetical protein